MSGTLERIKQFIDYKQITIRAFELAVGFSNGAFASQLKNKKSIGSDKIENILNKFPELNANWLFKGTGQMLARSDEESPLLGEPVSDYSSEVNRLQKELLEAQAEIIRLQKKAMDSAEKRKAS